MRQRSGAARHRASRCQAAMRATRCGRCDVGHRRGRRRLLTNARSTGQRRSGAARHRASRCHAAMRATPPAVECTQHRAAPRGQASTRAMRPLMHQPQCVWRQSRCVWRRPGGAPLRGGVWHGAKQNGVRRRPTAMMQSTLACVAQTRRSANDQRRGALCQAERCRGPDRRRCCRVHSRWADEWTQHWSA